jgi:ribonuclease HII
MPWIVGIDEAGYGPNLGPFVMTAVACHVGDAHADANLWDTLQGATRRAADPPGTRILVADSKVVFSQTRGLAELEHGVLAACHGRTAATIEDFLGHVGLDCRDEVRRELWYAGTTVLPVEADPDACGRAGKALGDHCETLAVRWGWIRSVVVCPAAFNALLDQWGTKAAVLTTSMVRLLRALPRDGEPVAVFIDKHGGRNAYSAMLQPAFDDGLVLAREEGALRSTYEVTDAGRDVRVTFEPRADGNHFCVAMASMVSKYLREVLMLEFNRFWQAKVPGVKATAGYPTDSTRFWEEILPTVRAMKIAPDTLWRRK